MPAPDGNHSGNNSSSASILAFRAEGPILNVHSRRWIKKYRTEISASSASLLSTLTAVWKTFLHTLGGDIEMLICIAVPTGLRQNAHAGVRTMQESKLSLTQTLQGAIAPLLSITLVRTVSFSIYQKAKYTYDDWIAKATGSSPLVHANSPGAMPSLSTLLCFGGAGATSGSVQSADGNCTGPFELTKLNAQIAVLMERGVGKHDSFEAPDRSRAPDRKQPTAGTFKTAKWITKQRGVMGLYSGFHLHLLRDTIGTTIYFTTYESSKQMLANARGNSPTSPLAVVMAGGLCGLVSWACIYPIDSAKSIYQRNVLVAGASDSEKPKRPRIEWFNRRMYRGLGVSMSRSCVINAIFFSAFEVVKKWVNGLDVEGEE
ncbi:MAG: hypothetical protein Q9159_002286 [Coniocarpon cinnabarinum]